jgi:hypothetical protein
MNLNSCVVCVDGMKIIHLIIKDLLLIASRALEVWGSHEALVKERLKKEIERKIYHQSRYIYLYIVHLLN